MVPRAHPYRVPWRSHPSSSAVLGTWTCLPWQCQPVSLALLLSPCTRLGEMVCANLVCRPICPFHLLGCCPSWVVGRAQNLESEDWSSNPALNTLCDLWQIIQLAWLQFACLCHKDKNKALFAIMIKADVKHGKVVWNFFNFKFVKHIQMLSWTILCNPIQYRLVLSARTDRACIPHKATRFLPHHRSPAIALSFFTTWFFSIPLCIAGLPCLLCTRPQRLWLLNQLAASHTGHRAHLTARPSVLAGRALVLKHYFIPSKYLSLSSTCHTASRQ